MTPSFSHVRGDGRGPAVRVTVLGSGDAFGSGGRLHSAYLIDAPGATFLVDCGPSVLQAMKRIGRDPEALDFVLLSHLHGDHFAGVPFLFMQYRYDAPRSRPFAVYGPPGTERRVRTLFSALYDKPSHDPMPFRLRFVELQAERAQTVGPVGVVPFRVPHAPELTAFGYRLTVAGRTIVYSGDSSWTDEFVPRARDADLFICECSTWETRVGIHISYPEIAAHAPALGCRRLLLSHLGREPLRRLDEITLECAQDGMTLDL